MYNLKFFLFLLAVTLWILHSFGQAYALPLYGGAEYAPTPTGTLLSQRILLPTATSVPTATAAAERSDEGRIELPIPAEQLPQPIFYLNLAGQIGYLDFDSHVQLTSEAAPITAFDVSPIDQRLVYVTNNALIELDWTSGKKVIKTTAISLDEADNKAVADKQLISAPRYSPDGSQITYIQNGVKLIAAGLDVATPPQDLLFDIGYDSTSPYSSAPPSKGWGVQVDLGKLTAPITSHNIGDVRSYYDIRWSPDGERLVLEMVGWEWVSHAIYTLSTARLQEMELQTVGVGLADSVWSQDGQMLTMSGWGAGPTARLINLHLPTGEVQRLDQTFTESTPPVGVIKAAFPLPSGKLLAFLIPELQPTHYNLFRLFWLSLDGAIDKPASDQTFIIQGEVLWAPDGSGALLMTSDISLPGEAAKGKYEWFSHETDRLTAPYIRGSHVRWGLPTKP